MEAELIEERNKIKEALDKIKVLRGLLPICSFCKKIRDDKGYWNQIDSYIHKLIYFFLDTSFWWFYIVNNNSHKGCI